MGSRRNSTGQTYSHQGREAEDSGAAGQALMDALSDDESTKHQSEKDEIEESYESHVKKPRSPTNRPRLSPIGGTS